MLSVLYEDKDILAVIKPAGIESQSARGFARDMVSEIRRYLAAPLGNPQNIHKLATKSSTRPNRAQPPYVGVIHRLDRPVSGIMVYAKNRTAAGALSTLMQQGKMEKWYKAVVCGKPVDNQGTYVDYLRQIQGENRSEIVDKSAEGSRRAELKYRVAAQTERQEEGEKIYSLVEIRLLTGRHHQIRVQFSSRGIPLYGDEKYGTVALCAGSEKTSVLPHPFPPHKPTPLALCAFRLVFPHPVTGKRLEFQMEPSGGAFDWFKTAESESLGTETV